MANEEYTGPDSSKSESIESEPDKTSNMTDIEIYEQIKEGFALIRDIRNTKDFLDTQNKELKARKSTLTSELDGIELVTASMSRDIEDARQRTEAALGNLKSLNDRRDELINSINSMKKSVKRLEEDNSRCQVMRDHLIVEFESISHEKAIIFKKLKGIEDGVKQMTGKKNAYNVPYLRSFDSLLKRVYRAFKEAEDRMDISLKLIN